MPKHSVRVIIDDMSSTVSDEDHFWDVMLQCTIRPNQRIIAFDLSDRDAESAGELAQAVGLVFFQKWHVVRT